MTINANCVVIVYAPQSQSQTGSTPRQNAERPQPEPEEIVPEKDERQSSSIPPTFFCISQRFTEKNIRERLSAELKQASTKIDYCRALYRLQNIGCINLNQYASDAQRAKVFNSFQERFTLSASDFSKARNSR